MTQTLSVVDILVAGKPAEHRLPEQANQRMTAILTSAGIGERLARHYRQAKDVVEFAIGQQSRIGGDARAMELKLHPAVEIQPERAINRFTRWVRHDGPA